MLALVALVAFLAAGPAAADSHEAEAEKGEATIKCTLRFDSTSWSFLVSKGKGEGKVSCDNGQEADVVISSTSVGVSLGAEKYENATGKFTNVTDIEDIFGKYNASSAAMAAGGSAGAAGLIKKDGDVKLGMFGTGKGGAAISRSWGTVNIERKPAE
jgi:hypothetical protein